MKLISYRLYSRVTQNDDMNQSDLADESEKKFVEDQVVEFLNEKSLEIWNNDISTCHILKSRRNHNPGPQNTDDEKRENIVVRLVKER